MYVRKFEAETIDSALKAVKKEFGPDAIILKTVTNKGLKGALKKNKIEITAAISEKDYTKKARVDTVLDDETRENFYQNNSSYISDMIDGHSDNRSEARESSRYEAKVSGYNQIGLNKTVQKKSNEGSSGLDDFLNANNNEVTAAQTLRSELPIQSNQLPSASQVRQEEEARREAAAQERLRQQEEARIAEAKAVQAQEARRSLERQEEAPKQQAGSKEQQKKIESLEKKIYELSRALDKIKQHEPIGSYQLRTTLRSLNINDHYINNIIKKANFELSKEELEDADLTFEFGLREMLKDISTSMPLFSETKNKDVGTVSVVISDSSCGQTSVLYKMAKMDQKSRVIQYCHETDKNFIPNILDIDIVKASTFAEMISAIRKGVEDKVNVLVDFKDLSHDINEAKKFIDGVKRSFAKVEVMICLSSIHSEIYNRKVVNKFSSLADGLIINHLDLCLDYGALFNIAFEHSGLPITFFGTGPVVPDDIEIATGERLLAGMFKLS